MHAYVAHAVRSHAYACSRGSGARAVAEADLACGLSFTLDGGRERNRRGGEMRALALLAGISHRLVVGMHSTAIMRS